MTQRIAISLTGEEAAMILEALETNREIYLESAKDAASDGSEELATVFGNAADRIYSFRTALRRTIESLRSRH